MGEERVWGTATEKNIYDAKCGKWNGSGEMILYWKDATPSWSMGLTIRKGPKPKKGGRWTDIAVFLQNKCGIKRSSNARRIKRSSRQHDVQIYLACRWQMLQKRPGGHKREEIADIAMQLYCSGNYTTDVSSFENHSAPFKYLAAANYHVSIPKFGGVAGRARSQLSRLRKKTRQYVTELTRRLNLARKRPMEDRRVSAPQRWTRKKGTRRTEIWWRD